MNKYVWCYIFCCELSNLLINLYNAGWMLEMAKKSTLRNARGQFYSASALSTLDRLVLDLLLSLNSIYNYIAAEMHNHIYTYLIVLSVCLMFQKERKAYEVVVHDGKLIYKQSGILVNSKEGSKSIFVLSTTRALYVGPKKKGQFQHSSFLSGGATTAAGRLVAHDGVLEVLTHPMPRKYIPH